MCELFVLETGVDILSRARVRVTYCALLRLSAYDAEGARPARNMLLIAS